MFKRVLLSTLIGGLLAYGWLALSWMVLPYHSQTLHQFKDEQAVLNSLKDNINKPGVYHFPYMGADKHFASKEDEQKDMDQTMKQMDHGPTVFVSYHDKGSPMSHQMMMGVGLNLVAALILSLMMAYVARHGFFCRLGFAWLFALNVGLLGALPGYIWWQFDCSFVTLEFLDYVIAWGLAGFVMTLIMKKPEAN